MMRRTELMDRGGTPELRSEAQIWGNADMTDQERSNLALVERMWAAWKAAPVDLDGVRKCLHPDVIVRTGWRGEEIVQGREAAMALYVEETERQTEHHEVTDFRFPIVVAKGPIVFHTWIWIAHSARLGYHIERPMAAHFLITDGLIERWDNYSTGRESEPGYVSGGGLDGL
jgi:hypothetical protein